MARSCKGGERVFDETCHLRERTKIKKKSILEDFRGLATYLKKKRICREIRRKRSAHRAVEPMTVSVIMKMKEKKEYCVF
jgi:hypothetical protein